MDLSHAAALALVGWYLLAPPIKSRNVNDMSAPLAKWDQWGRSPFESEKACQNWQYCVAMLSEFRSGQTCSDWMRVSVWRTM